jgi:hypothetical protein
MYKKFNAHILKVAEEAEFVKVLNTELCRWFRFAQLAKGKKSRP